MSLSPKTMDMFDFVGTLVGGGFEGGGKIVSGFGSNQQAQYEAAALRNNILIAKDAERAALAAGKAQVQERQIETQQTIAQQETSFAGRGIVVGQGTADVLAADATRIGKLDEITIMENARRQALAYKLQGINYSLEAKAAEKEGKAALYGGLLTGGATLLGTAGLVHQKWSAFQNTYGGNDSDDLGIPGIN